jgi:flagellar M-ring protein FliF
VNQLIENFKQLWNKASLVQRIVVLGSLLGVLAGSIAVFGWASKPTMRLLYGQLNQDDAAKIMERLEEAGIAYELKNSGTSIYVPTKEVANLRITLSKDGLPSGGIHGAELLEEKPPLGDSPEVTKSRIRRAMEGELARSICIIEGIKHCRVHIVPAERTLFGTSSDREAKASVTVTLSPGMALSSRNVQAIVHLVSCSVRGLDPQNVTLVDNHGTALSGDGPDEATQKASNYLEHKTLRERTLLRKVEALLETALGKGNYKVELALNLDNKLETIESHTFDPKQKAPVSEQLETSKSDGGRVASVLPGGTNGQAARLARAPGSESTMRESVQYVYPVIRSRQEKASYDRKSVSVSALVDLKAAPQREDGSKVTVEQVRKLISGAINAQPSDFIQVSDVPFPSTTGQAVGNDGETTFEFYLELAKRLSLGLLVIGALIALKIVTRGKSKESKADKRLESATAGALTADGRNALEGGATGQLPGGYTQDGHLLEANPQGQGRRPQEQEEEEEDELFGIDMLDEDAPLGKRLAVAMRKNPKRVKQLFKSWVQSEEVAD